ncbi:hypothetical protein KKF91_12720 [Myxococcota bacterium]|nr:hypothetical protein [Myxococcota bacterium]MBU1431397.1 hypothetical protein [Myxococcota bacterium]MBU1900518.1 hypothetical protein [Myxococcota bacterium]
MLYPLWLSAALVAWMSPPLPAFEGFTELAMDPAPAALTRNSHYWVSNEYRHDVYQAAIEGLGGVHIGVGTDQNYILAGWSRPELLVLMDFDMAIPRLHQIYRLMFRAAESPEAMIALWAPTRRAEVEGWIDAAYGGQADIKKIKQTFRAAQKAVYGRLRQTRRAYLKRGVPVWLTDAAQYAWLRHLWASNRVFAVRGDLTGGIALLDIAQKLKAAGLTVRTMYTSNAEQYFEYGPQFKANIKALPFDEKSLILHTVANGRFKKIDGHYHYVWQRGFDFQANLEDGAVKKLRPLLRKRGVRVDEGVSKILGPN